MLCLEWWMFEIGGFLAGLISEAELGAQSIVYELATIAYMFPLGFSVSASVRVGNALGALCNLIGYYFIGFPIGVSLMFAANMGIVGLWSGLFICVIIQSIFFTVFVSKLNWKKATEEALVRSGVQLKESKETVFGMENEDLSPEALEGAV